MRLKFQDPRWRFKSPGSIPEEAISAFLKLVDAIAEQNDAKGVYELFKDRFHGTATPSSTSTIYARSDLEQLMKGWSQRPQVHSRVPAGLRDAH